MLSRSLTTHGDFSPPEPSSFCSFLFEILFLAEASCWSTWCQSLCKSFSHACLPFPLLSNIQFNLLCCCCSLTRGFHCITHGDVQVSILSHYSECGFQVLCLLFHICQAVAHSPGCFVPLWNYSLSVKHLAQVTTCTIKNGYHLVALILFPFARPWAGWDYTTEFRKGSEGELGHLCVTGPSFHLLMMFFLIEQRSLGKWCCHWGMGL